MSDSRDEAKGSAVAVCMTGALVLGLASAVLEDLSAMPATQIVLTKAAGVCFIFGVFILFAGD